MTPLVTKKFVYELIIRVHWPEDPGEVCLEMAPDVLGDEGLGGLGGVEAIHGLYQLVNQNQMDHGTLQYIPVQSLGWGSTATAVVGLAL